MIIPEGDAPRQVRGLDRRRRHGQRALTRSPARCGARATRRSSISTAPTRNRSSSINFLLNEEMFKMFFGAFTINLFDPQILFNDGFYDLLEVRIPGRLAS